jgi:PAS domain S-box-containing protein
MEKTPIRTLIIEDNPAEMALLKNELSGCRRTVFDVTGVKDLKEASDALGRDKYAIILLDLNLPGSSGIESYNEIKAMSGDSPVIIMTGNSDSEVMENAARLGAQDYFVKGNYDIDSLEKAIKYSIERKRREKLLKDSEEKYRNIFNYAEVGLFRSKIDGSGMLDFNTRMQNILGYTSEELLNVAPDKIWIDGQMKEKMFDELRRASVLNDYEMDITVKGGRIKNVLVSMKIFSKERDIQGAISDITKLKQSQCDLKESEDNFRSAFEQAAVGIAFTDTKGKFIRVNQRYCDIVGYKKEELTGKNFSDITSPMKLEEDMLAVKRMISGDLRVYKTEKQYIKKDGTRVWADLTVSLARHPDNSPKYFVAVTEDITEKKDVEERWKSFSNATDGQLLVWDRYLNLAAANTAAYDEYEKLNGKKLKAGCQFEGTQFGLKDPELVTKLHDVLRTGEPYSVDGYEVKRGKGEPAFYLFKSFRIANGLGIIITNITEKISSAVKLKNNYEKLMEVDRLKSNFISIISHELRTPLTIIKGFTAFLIKEAAGTLNAAQKNFASTIALNIDRLARIINDMVDVSKIESGLFSIDKKPNDLVGIVNESVDSMDCIADDHGIRLVRAVTLTSAPLDADKGRLIQAISNLLNNAIRFSKKWGFITIDLNKADAGKLPEKIGVRLKKGVTYYMLSVSDTGPGIEKKYLEKIFERFFQVENADVRQHQGTGLGLSVAQSIVEAHDGFIWAESEGLNRGAKLVMLLPGNSDQNTAGQKQIHEG